MEAPKLAWFGNEPVVVGDEIPEHPDGHVRIWRFVSGSEADAHPDELDGGGGHPFASRVRQQASEAAGSVRDFSRVGTSSSAAGAEGVSATSTQPQQGLNIE